MKDKIKHLIWLPRALIPYRALFLVALVLYFAVSLFMLFPNAYEFIVKVVIRVIIGYPTEINYHSLDRVVFLFGIVNIVIMIVFLCIGYGILPERVYKKLQSKERIFCTCLPFYIVLIGFFIFNRACYLGIERIFLSTTALGKMIPFNETVEAGRFFPLAFFHNNILALIAYVFNLNAIPAFAHYMIRVLNFLMFSLLYIWFLKLIKIKNNPMFLVSILFVLLLPFYSNRFIFVLGSSMYPESIMLTLTILIYLLIYKARETNKTGYYISAAFASLYLTYCKEPVFGFLIIISLTNLLFNSKSSLKEKIFYCFLIINGVIYLLLYYFLSYTKAAEFYGSSSYWKTKTILNYLVFIFLNHRMLIMLFTLCIVRLYFVIFKRSVKHIYFDSLLFGCTAYAFAIMILRFGGWHYFSFPIISSIPVFAYWGKYLSSLRNKFYFLIYMFPIALICSTNMVEEIFFSLA